MQMYVIIRYLLNLFKSKFIFDLDTDEEEEETDDDNTEEEEE